MIVSSIRTSLSAVGLLASLALAGAEPVHYERDIRPILKANCFHCHGEGETKGGVDLRLVRFMTREIDSGSIVKPGDPENSILLKVLASGEMPKNGKPLPPEKIALLEEWVRQGAKTTRPEPEQVPKFYITEEERQFWSFRPIQRPAIPDVKKHERARHPIDALVLDKLASAELSMAEPAAPAVLLRRVTEDLTGLPPTPAELANFLADESHTAYERQLDRLLASPRYGEHWGRHWLDVAGYADSNGGTDTDSARPWAWRYRDYVIRALNADKPLSEFITEQLAGDELVAPPYDALPPEELDKLVATGFLRMAPDPTGDGPADAELARNQVVADTIQIVSSSLLGLTVQCAQCHDHRYDPIPQSDYYRLRAVFEPALDWKNWRAPSERQVSLMPRADREKAERIEKEAKKYDDESRQLHDELIEKFVQKQLLLVPEDMRAPVLAARRTPSDKRSEEHKKLLRDFPTFQDNILLGEIDPEGMKRVEAVRQKATDIRAKRPVDPMVHCLLEPAGAKAETFLFHRGDHQQPKEKVSPGGLSVLADVVPPELPSAKPIGGSTGRRLAFAQMLTNGRHPLTARTLVNRSWHHLFGSGLAPTLGDLGALGERPKKPELIDWLASELIAQGWSLKYLQRQILCSAVYRQSATNAASEASDPDNQLLGRMRIKRLEGETLRDGILALSGRLYLAMQGAPVPIGLDNEGQVIVGAQAKDRNGDPTGVDSSSAEVYRRSIYVEVRRSAPLGLMETFDTAALSPNCDARASSTSPPQSLLMMNDQFVIERSLDLAKRLREEKPGNLQEQVRLLWSLVYCAPPTTNETKESLAYLAEQAETFRANSPKDPKAAPVDPGLQALSSLCQAMLASNRFLYVD